MALKPIEVNVNAAQFGAYVESFNKYNQTLEAMPKVWRTIAEEAREGRNAFAETVAQFQDLASQLDKILNAHKKNEESVEHVGRGWRGLADSTKHVARNIAEATKSLLKWSGIFGITTGLLGLGGLWGLDRLGSSAAGQRTSAMGLGTSYGKMNSFMVNFGRIGDAGGILERVNTAMSDYNSRQGLYGLGLKENEIHGDSADVAARAIEKLGKLMDNTPAGQEQQALDSTHAGDMFTLDQALRIKKMSKEEREQLGASYKKDQDALSLTAIQQKRWQDFATQMDRAGKEMEKSLITGLVNITPGLKDLSAAVTKLVDKLFEENGPVSQWLSEASLGLEYLANHIDTPEFRDMVTGFIDGLDSLGKVVIKVGGSVLTFLKWLDNMTGTNYKDGLQNDDKLNGRGPALTPNRGMSLGSGPGGRYTGPAAAGKWWTDDRIKHAYQRLRAQGVSDLGARALVSRWAVVEASGGPASSNGSHWGIAQWDRSRAGAVWQDPDFDRQLDHAAKELNSSERKALGRLNAAKTPREAAAGASTFERAENYNPSTGEDAWTSKTEAGMAAVDSALNRQKNRPGKPHTRVIINKNTGGNPISTGNAMAVP